MRSRLSKNQRQILSTYVLEYRKRGVMGEWWDFMEALEVALKEIQRLRRFCRHITYERTKK